MSNFKMQLKFYTTQHNIKVEIKEEVMDIQEEDENPSQDYVQESTSFKANPPKVDVCFHHRSTPYLENYYSGLRAICSSMTGKLQQRKVQKKIILTITPPQTFTPGWCTTKRAQLIINFLENFAKLSQSSKDSRSANFNIASNGPRFLHCEECSRFFSGLHDRYLKIFLHYKTCHKERCNTLIGRKWVKHHSTVQNMMTAWQRDLHYIEKYKTM